ncbi:uncharacterized protein E0L32_006578 [Thyridium curvatum]|uniref:Histone chaperone RTT106/FACT complex subunit SPT16-like middle domain-containing protein n=1 Tax=Thyridium curvatum TaxID=1093900 RepID=A0A507AZ71_9PEZI|nr:uncharacterized protein E0L32_006578 [Thyridium curvatum]TPX12933.1 hypothetical protein E0L32_006578 [Thyridium curvatum]
MASLDTERLRLVFEGRPDILTGIEKAADTPERVSLFNKIASFVQERLAGDSSQDGPAAKRRRVDVGNANGHANGTSSGGASSSGEAASTAAAAEPVLLEVKDISVSIPQRKKFDLCMTKNYLYARVSGASAPAQGIVYAWKDIEYAFYVPVPEKTQLQYNYILFPRNTSLTSLKAGATADVEPFVFTVPSTGPKPGTVGGPGANTAASVSDTYSSLFNWALTNQMRSVGNRTSIVASDAKVFHSMMRQSHRPNEKAVHVKAFRGSKDGYLFFLPAGILWGFKKPLLFIPLDRIAAVSYTSVLQRTFNMVVEVDLGDEQAEEVEFSMIDQEDYGVIDEKYVKRHALQDRSMADKRKAKRELAENAKDGKKKGEAGGEEGADGGAAGEPDDGLTELQRAEQALQDEEDEDEEDYDPGSDGDSDGSGTDSDEDDDDGGEGGEGEMDEDEDEDDDE